jgi:hypothetical protein
MWRGGNGKMEDDGGTKTYCARTLAKVLWQSLVLCTKNYLFVHFFPFFQWRRRVLRATNLLVKNFIYKECQEFRRLYFYLLVEKIIFRKHFTHSPLPIKYLSMVKGFPQPSCTRYFWHGSWTHSYTAKKLLIAGLILWTAKSTPHHLQGLFRSRDLGWARLLAWWTCLLIPPPPFPPHFSSRPGPPLFSLPLHHSHFTLLSLRSIQPNPSFFSLYLPL